MTKNILKINVFSELPKIKIEVAYYGDYKYSTLQKLATVKAKDYLYGELKKYDKTLIIEGREQYQDQQVGDLKYSTFNYSIK